MTRSNWWHAIWATWDTIFLGWNLGWFLYQLGERQWGLALFYFAFALLMAFFLQGEIRAWARDRKERSDDPR